MVYPRNEGFSQGKNGFEGNPWWSHGWLDQFNKPFRVIELI